MGPADKGANRLCSQRYEAVSLRKAKPTRRKRLCKPRARPGPAESCLTTGSHKQARLWPGRQQPEPLAGEKQSLGRPGSQRVLQAQGPRAILTRFSSPLHFRPEGCGSYFKKTNTKKRHRKICKQESEDSRVDCQLP